MLSPGTTACHDRETGMIEFLIEGGGGRWKDELVHCRQLATQLVLQGVSVSHVQPAQVSECLPQHLNPETSQNLQIKTKMLFIVSLVKNKRHVPAVKVSERSPEC